MATRLQVAIVGSVALGTLESSYKTAFEALGHRVVMFNMVRTVEQYTRLGSFGRKFSAFVPVEPWVRKANRDLVLQVLEQRPDLVLVIGSQAVRAGALAQMKISGKARLGLVWPDSFVNLDGTAIACLPVYDFVATYSSSSVEMLKKLGTSSVLWAPLAADPTLHPRERCAEAGADELRADVSFIGGWRPERERALSQLASFDLKIWGPDWDRRARGNRAILRAWQGRPILGREFARVVACSKINLNVIDPTNYPAANMRFFEIPVAGGLQVSSPCPEMSGEFVHGEHIFYCRDSAELPDLIRMLLRDDGLRQRVAEAGHQKVMAGHKYEDRARAILAHCGLQ